MPLKYRSLCPHPGTQTDEERAASHAKIKAGVERTKRLLAERDAIPARRRVREATSDPLAPKIDKWLRSIEKRQELVIRYAMRERWATVRASRSFSARVKELEDYLKLDEDQLAMVIREARQVSAEIEDVVDGEPRRR